MKRALDLGAEDERQIGGVDLPDYGGTETFAVMFDIDQDGAFDIIAGVDGSNDLSGLQVALFDETGAPMPRSSLEEYDVVVIYGD